MKKLILSLFLLSSLVQTHASETSKTNLTKLDKKLLRAAGYYRDIVFIEDLIEKGANVNVKDRKGKTPLHRASEKGLFEAVKILMRNGADPNLEDDTGRTPLDWSFDRNWDVHPGEQKYVSFEQTANYLIRLTKNGADVNAKDIQGRTLLHRIVHRTNSFKKVKFLIKNGADVNARDEDGNTPLHYAAPNPEVVYYLIQKGATVDVKNEYNRTPFHFACSGGNFKFAKFLIDKYGADETKCVREKFKDNQKSIDKALFDASFNGDFKTIRLLIRNGADVNARDADGNTPLHYASILGYFVIAETLIKNGAYVNAVDEDGNTALHLAFKFNNIELGKLLVDNKSDVNVKNDRGHTPLNLWR